MTGIQDGIQDASLLRKVLCNGGIKGIFRGTASLVVGDLNCLKLTETILNTSCDFCLNTSGKLLSNIIQLQYFGHLM